MTDSKSNSDKTVNDRLNEDPSVSPADHEAALQEDRRQEQADEQAKIDKQMAKDGPQGPEVNTPNLSASVVDGHDLSEHVSQDGQGTKGGTVSHTGNDATRTPGPSGSTGKSSSK